MTTFATKIRDMANRWTIEGCKAFDEANTPAEVAEAAGKLRCALELSQLLDTLEGDTGKRWPSAGRGDAGDRLEIISGSVLDPERRADRHDRRRKSRTDRRKRN